MDQYQIAVIGGGPGGYVAAIRAAQMGAKVCVVEKERLGGTCLNWGCIPTKALLACSEALAHAHRAEEFGLKIDNLTFDFAKIMQRKQEVVDKLVGGIEFLFKSQKISLYKGKGVIAGPNRINVEATDGGAAEISADNIIIATGSRPALIPAFGIDGQQVLTSDHALAMTRLPKSMIIIGGGVIGSEFTCLLSELGVEITIIEMMPNILPTEDRAIGTRMQSYFKRRGIKIITKARITEVVKNENSVTAKLDSGEEVSAEQALVSIGRAVNTQGIGLEIFGVELGQRGEIKVNDYMQTNVPGVYAIGDVVGKIMLAHVASRQGIVAISNIMGKPTKMDYDVVPSTIFTTPEIASVGLTADKAAEKGYEVKLGNFTFMALGKAIAMGEAEGMIRLVADAKTDRLLGAQIMGPHATDLIGEVALAVKLGATSAQLADTIHSHPTLAEAVAEAAEDVHGMAIHVAKKK